MTENLVPLIILKLNIILLIGAHIAFMALVLIIFLFLFIIYPFILIKWIREQVFSGDRKRHEGFLQLKEAEYEQGLDILWDIGMILEYSNLESNNLKTFHVFKYTK